MGTWVQVVGTGTGAGVYRWIPLSGAFNFCGKSRKAAVSRGIFRKREKNSGTAGRKKAPRGRGDRRQVRSGDQIDQDGDQDDDQSDGRRCRVRAAPGTAAELVELRGRSLSAGAVRA